MDRHVKVNDPREMTIVRGGMVIPDLGSEHSVENSAVLVNGDEIIAVARYEELANEYPTARQLGTQNHVVIPGLVNAHHHGYGLTSLQLGIPDDHLEPWLLHLRGSAPYVDLFLDTLFSAVNLLRNGVTTVLHAGVPRGTGTLQHETRTALRAYEDSGLRVAYAVQIQDQNHMVYQPDDLFLESLPVALRSALGSALMAIPYPTVDEYLALVRDVASTYAEHPRIKIFACPFAPQWCSDLLLREVRDLAEELSLGIHMHALESRLQKEYGRRAYRKSTIEHLADVDLLGPRTSIAHGVWMTDQEMDLCAASDTSIVHNASSNLRLRNGVLPLPRLLERGVNVALGLDCMGLNDDEDILQELRLVANIHRMPQRTPKTHAIEPTDVLRTATTNGARVIGEELRIGKLEPGMKADLVLIDKEQLFFPHVDERISISQLLLSRARSVHVDTVMVDGRVLMDGRTLTHLNERNISSELVQSIHRSDEADAFADLMSAVRQHAVEFYETWRLSPAEALYVPHSLS